MKHPKKLDAGYGPMEVMGPCILNMEIRFMGMSKSDVLPYVPRTRLNQPDD